MITFGKANLHTLINNIEALGINFNGRFVGKTIRWLRAPEEKESVKSVRKVMAVGLAAILSFSIIGIIPLVLGLKEWKRQDIQDSQKNDHNTEAAVSSPSDKTTNSYSKIKGTAISKVNPQTENVQPEPRVNPYRTTQTVEEAKVTVEREYTSDIFAPPLSDKRSFCTAQETDSFAFTKVTNEHVMNLQGQLETVNQKYGKLDLEKMKGLGLLPIHQMTIGNATFYCNKPFRVDKHLHSIALVEIEGKVYPRLLYHSNSQGTWRVIPFAKKSENENGEKTFRWFGKGNKTEAETELPFPVTVALNSLIDSDSVPKNENDVFDIHKIVQTFPGGCIFDYFKNDPDMIEAVVMVDIFPSILDKMSAKEEKKQEEYKNNGKKRSNIPNMPEDPQQHPNFSEPQLEVQQWIPEYGDVTVRIFPSRNRNLEYMFIEAHDKRVFLAGLQYRNEKLNEFGIRQRIPDPLGMNAPLLEYWGQIYWRFIPADFESYKHKDGLYANNWNYIRNHPIIKKYYEVQQSPLPDPFPRAY